MSPSSTMTAPMRITQNSRGETMAAALLSPWLFWGILIAAVVVLLGLIARLVRKPAA